MNRTVQAQSIVLMDELVEDVCWRLASTASVARVGFVSDDAVQVLPVNIAVIGRVIVFRTAAGSMLDALDSGSPLVVEIDAFDQRSHTGWSVVARGPVERVNGDLLPLIGNAVHPWAYGERDVWLRVRPQQITGRAISRPVVHTPFRLPYVAIA